MTTYVIRRKSDGYFYKNAIKPRYAWRKSPEELRADIDKLHWQPDLQRARTYTNRGGASNALPYKANPDDYSFVPVELVIVPNTN